MGSNKQWKTLLLTAYADDGTKASTIKDVGSWIGHAIKGGKELELATHTNRRYMNLYSGGNHYQLERKANNNYFEINLPNRLRICVRVHSLKAFVYYTYV